jgi:cation/acetate symporter
MSLFESAAGAGSGPREFSQRLYRFYGGLTLAFFIFIALLVLAERLRMPKVWLGMISLLVPVLVYAGIGILSRTSDADEYYVAGRRVPAFFNGMATAADWMSAASFVGLIGTVYMAGYGGLAYIMGWTGGFCLVALLIAPYLNRFGQFTIPDFLGARFEGSLPRLIGAGAAVLCSFTYVVAQLYAVGLVTSRLTGLSVEVGVLVGLGGVLMCSFLGGMRAITWTQVAQCIVLLIAFMLPVVWLSIKQTGVPLPHLVFGTQLQLVSEREQQIRDDPREQQVSALLSQQVVDYDTKLRDIPAALAADVAAAQSQLARLQSDDAALASIQAAKRTLGRLPRDAEEARRNWSAARDSAAMRAQPLAGMPPHAQAFRGDPDGDAAQQREFQSDRRNFLALMFCLMVGTAGLPHILARCYTTPSARAARESVAWSLLFISVLYLTVPVLAVLIKLEVFNTLVGMPMDGLPAWVGSWSKLNPNLLSVSDINGDGVLQLAELQIDSDIFMLITPELAGMPYAVSGIVAAGGLAAALSTADGLLLTIASALSHDVYHRIMAPGASPLRRVAVSKLLLLAAAMVAANLAVLRPANILFLVSAAFSLAASAFFPALVMGIFWKRANKWGAVAGMLAGLGLAAYYMAVTHPWLRAVFGINSPLQLWWDLQPVAAGVFGVPAGFAAIVAVSLLTPPPGAQALALVDRLRAPSSGTR